MLGASDPSAADSLFAGKGSIAVSQAAGLVAAVNVCSRYATLILTYHAISRLLGGVGLGQLVHH